MARRSNPAPTLERWSASSWPRAHRRAWAWIGCTLLLGGCSSGASGPHAAGHGVGVSAHLSPEPPSSAVHIAVVLSDPRVDLGNCRFEWRRNGLVVANATTNALEPSQFAKNDDIAVKVMLPGPGGAALQTIETRARVANAPPKMTRVTLAMVAAADGSQLQANAECIDSDHDAPVYAYQWYQNGHVVAGAAGSSLSARMLARGDRVVVNIVASDGESSSPPLRSEEYTIDNRPPQFSSQPVAPRIHDQEFHYQAVAADPDGDPLRYELVSGPAGMTVDAHGSVSWTLPLPEPGNGEYPVKLRAVDSNGGEAVQEFTIRLGALAGNL